jgi:hypothetical protein
MKIDRINIIVPHLHDNQLGYCITKHCNQLSERGIDCVVFTEEIRPFTITPKFAVMNISEAYDQPGLTISTTPSTTSKLQHCWAPNQKVFYSWDLYWLRGQRKMYKPILDLYHVNMDIIARSESHKTAIENCFNIKVKSVIDDFDVLKIAALYEDTNGKETKESTTTQTT